MTGNCLEQIITYTTVPVLRQDTFVLLHFCTGILMPYYVQPKGFLIIDIFWQRISVSSGRRPCAYRCLERPNNVMFVTWDMKMQPCALRPKLVSNSQMVASFGTRLEECQRQARHKAGTEHQDSVNAKIAMPFVNQKNLQT